jgi:hypothetical protein
MDTDYRLLEALQQAGREAAQSFLSAHFADIGERATLDVRAPAPVSVHAETV